MKHSAALSSLACISRNQHQHLRTWFRAALVALGILVLSAGAVFAQTANCTAKPITPEQAVSGTLSSTSCKSPFQNNPADWYSFDGVAGRKVTILLTSATLDTYLYLIGPDGKVKAEDDNSGGGQSSRIVMQLPATGAYQIEATVRGSKTTGDYRLLLSFSGSACVYLNTIDPDPFTSYGGLGTISITTSPGCAWTASSALAWVKFESAQAGTSSATVYYRVARNDFGSARIGTITAAGQSLSIKQFGNALACFSSPISAGQTKSGTLSQGDCASAFRTGGASAPLSDRYYFNVFGGQKIAITLISSSFDAYLYFVGIDGQLLKEDDNSAGGTDARFPAKGFFDIVSSGRYLIEVTSAGGGQRGAYNLTLEALAGGCGFDLTKKLQIVAAADGKGEVEIKTDRSCPWQAFSDSSWIAVQAPGGTGNGAIHFTAEYNTDQAPRTGHLLIGGKTFAVAQLGGNPVGTVSAASFSDKQLAPESIIASFGVGLATEVKAAGAPPLPTELAKTRVKVLDSENVAHDAGLFFVSPGQVNLLIPAATAIGDAMITITSGDGKNFSTGLLHIKQVAPSLFTANSSGEGVPTGYVLRVKADGSRTEEALAEFDTEQNRFVAVPIDFGDESDQVYLVLFGTGFRGRTDLKEVSVKIGGVNAQVAYAGQQGGLIGVDQLNVQLSRNLAGLGEVDLVLAIDEIAANVVKLNFK